MCHNLTLRPLVTQSERIMESYVSGLPSQTDWYKLRFSSSEASKVNTLALDDTVLAETRSRDVDFKRKGFNTSLWRPLFVCKFFLNFVNFLVTLTAWSFLCLVNTANP